MATIACNVCAVAASRTGGPGLNKPSWNDGWSVFLWSRNLLDKQYYEFLTAQPGNSGLIVGLPGDPRTVGVTLRMALRR